MKVIVVGSGPAGLLAAEAVAQSGHSLYVATLPVRSMIGGAQYIHHHIPEVTRMSNREQLTYRFIGTAEGYAQKVYGRADAPTSWTKFVEFNNRWIDCWSMPELYDNLWAKWEHVFVDTPVDLDWIQRMLETGVADKVISTMPLKSLVPDPEAWNFKEQNTYVINGGGKGQDQDDVDENHITYNGDPHDAWSRKSTLFGYNSTEYYSPTAGTKRIMKPVSCDWKPPRSWSLHLCGRYGKWDKNVLAHDAYFETLELLK